MYVALQGRVSIYVIGKDAAKDGSRENEAINAEVLDFLNEVCSKKKLDRSALGVLVYSGVGRVKKFELLTFEPD